MHTLLQGVLLCFGDVEGSNQYATTQHQNRLETMHVVTMHVVLKLINEILFL
jgi:hypothetical protein